MTKVVFKSYNPNDSLLLPPCLGDYLPRNHKARVVSAIIDRLDISDIESGYKGGGTSSYNPRMLLKVIVYAYLNNVYSGRQMENADEEQELTADEMAKRADNILNKMDEAGISDKKMRKAVEKVKTEKVPRMREYEKKLDTLGERNSYSKTDPDATFMRMKEDAMNNGQTKPGYNIQIATENQFITNYDIFWRPTDQGTLIPFLESFKDRYGKQSEEVCADSGYGSEQNYEYMFDEGITPYVKYNMFHAEDKRSRRNNPFLTQNLYYNAEDNYYVCPMGQHMEHIGDVPVKSDLGYVSTISRYRARNCAGCPLRGMYHRSNRPVEPEAVFGDIKYNHGFKRFRLRSNEKVKVEFGLVALAHNIRKYMAVSISKNDNNSADNVLKQACTKGSMQWSSLAQAS